MRRIFILLCCIMLMVALACSASAVAIGWEDYVITNGVTNDIPWAECVFPASMARINVYDGNTLLEGVSGGATTESWTAGQIPRFRYLPFGQQGTSAAGVGKLQLKEAFGNNTYGIPNGTLLTFDLIITGNAASLSNAAVNSTIVYYDEDEVFLSEVQLDYKPSTSLPYAFQFSYGVDAPADAMYMAILIDIRSNVALTSATSIGIYCSNLTMRGDGLLYHDWRSDLEDIKGGLFDQFSPVLPEVIVPGDLTELESSFFEKFQETVELLIENFASIVDTLGEYGIGFLFLSALLGRVFENAVIVYLVSISASLGVLAFILNIVPSILDTSDRAHRVRYPIRKHFAKWRNGE